MTQTSLLEQTIQELKTIGMQTKDYLVSEWERAKTGDIDWNYVVKTSGVALPLAALVTYAATQLQLDFAQEYALRIQGLQSYMQSPQFAQDLDEASKTFEEIKQYYEALPDTPENRNAFARETFGLILKYSPEFKIYALKENIRIIEQTIEQVARDAGIIVGALANSTALGASKIKKWVQHQIEEHGSYQAAATHLWQELKYNPDRYD